MAFSRSRMSTESKVVLSAENETKSGSYTQTQSSTLQNRI